MWIRAMKKQSQFKPNFKKAKNERKCLYNKGLQKKDDFAVQKNKPNFFKDKMNVSTILIKDYENIPDWTLIENKPNQSQFQTAGKRTKEAQKKKRVSGTFLRLWVAGKIDILDGCDILLGKSYGKSQFNLFWRLIL